MKWPTPDVLSDMAFKLAKAYERDLYPDLKLPDNLIDGRVMKYGLCSVFFAELQYLPEVVDAQRV